MEKKIVCFLALLVLVIDSANGQCAPNPYCTYPCTERLSCEQMQDVVSPFPESQRNLFICIAEREANFEPCCVNPSDHIGLYQLSIPLFAGNPQYPNCPQAAGLCDPNANAACAANIFNDAGIQPWKNEPCVLGTYESSCKYTGPTCPNQCSGHGQCVNGQCQCSPCWSGGDCSTPNTCSGHGQCVNGQCQCSPCWSGGDCSTLNTCSGHGQCVNGQCQCDACWQGSSQCSVPTPCPGGCGHGSCQCGKCVCDTCAYETQVGWTGATCSDVPPLSCSWQVLSANLNNDKSDDLLYVHRPYSGQSWWVDKMVCDVADPSSGSWKLTAYGNNGIGQTMLNGGGVNNDYRAIVGDFNGDGFEGYAVISRTSACPGNGWCDNIYMNVNRNGSMTFEAWPSGTPQAMFNGAETTPEYYTLAGDFNGDGKTDLATISRARVQANGWFNNIYVDLSTGRGFHTGAWKANTPTDMFYGSGTTQSYAVFAGHLNHDNMTDLVTVTVPQKCPGESWCGAFDVELSTGSGFKSARWNSATPNDYVNGAIGSIDQVNVVAGDFNGDGLLDLLSAMRPINCDGDGWCQWFRIDMSTGSGFDSQAWSTTTPHNMYNGGGSTKDYATLVGDFNGDGLDDVATLTRPATCPGSGFCDGYYMDLNVNGTHFVNQVWASSTPQWMVNGAGTPAYYEHLVMDVNGDGLSDVVTVNRPFNSASDGWAKVVLVDVSTGKSFKTSAWPSQVPMQIVNEDQLFSHSQ